MTPERLTANSGVFNLTHPMICANIENMKFVKLLNVKDESILVNLDNVDVLKFPSEEQQKQGIRTILVFNKGYAAVKNNFTYVEELINEQ